MSFACIHCFKICSDKASAEECCKDWQDNITEGQDLTKDEEPVYCELVKNPKNAPRAYGGGLITLREQDIEELRKGNYLMIDVECSEYYVFLKMRKREFD